MNKKLFLSLLLLAFLAGGGHAADYYIDAAATTGNLTGDGSSGTPWQTLSYAVTQTTTGDAVHLAAGIYNGAMTGSSESFPIDLGWDRSYLGAGAGATTIEGGGSTDVLTGYGGLTIEGLTVNGLGGNSGIELYEAGNYIASCLIYGAGSGAGVRFEGSDPSDGGGTVASCEVRNVLNGIYLNSTWSDSVITGNLIHSFGNAGVYDWLGPLAGQLEISHNLIRDGSNGLYLRNGVILIENNTIVDNWSNGLWAMATITSRNNIYAYNSGRGIYRTSGACTSTYDDSWGNGTNWDPATITGAGTISANPRFVDRPGDDYNLNYNSPCIDRGTPAGTDMGAYPFDLSVPGTMAAYVIEPNGGEVLSGSATFEITWYATKEGGAYDHVEIFYSSNGGAGYDLVTDETENDGSYVWTVPDVDSTQALIRLTAVGSAVTDESDGFFTTSSSLPPDISVMTPNGGEIWRYGKSYDITWETSPGVDRIDLYYSLDNGVTYAVIATGEANDGAYAWAVPNQPTTEALISIEAYKGALVNTDESDSVFTLSYLPLSFEVVAPLAGQTYRCGGSLSVSWESYGSPETVSLYYSTDGGTTYTRFATDEADTGAYLWSIPFAPTTEARIKLEGKYGTQLGSAESDLFTLIEVSDVYVNVNTGSNSYNGLTSEVGTFPDGPWKNLGRAATESLPGDTIHVAAGLYNAAAGEGFWPLLGWGRHYIGAGSAVTTLETGVQLGSVSTFEGFGVYYVAGGVNVIGLGAEVRDCYIEGSSTSVAYGVNFGNFYGGRVTSCEIVGYEYGVSADDPHDVTVEWSTIRGCGENGVYLYDCDGGRNYLIANNIIRANGDTAQDDEGGVRVRLGSPTVSIEGNVIVGNNRYGVIVEEGTANLTNNIICGSTAPNEIPTNYSTSCFVDTPAVLNYSYNDIWNLRYLAPEGGGTINDLGNNISVCPETVDPWNNDYHLYAGSPCIGTGAGGVNMGAYEGAGQADNPYKSVSYVNVGSGVDAATAARGTSEAYPWKTVSFANKYSTGRINVAPGLYNAAAGETSAIYLPTYQQLRGAGRANTTLEDFAVNLYFDSTLEAITLNAGIVVHNARNEVRDCLISGAGSGTGLTFYGSANNYAGAKVLSCEVTGFNNGFSMSAHVATSIEGCVIHANTGYGIYKNATGSIGIRRNLFLNNASGGMSLYFGNNYVENNTFVGNRRGINIGAGYLYSKNNIITNKADGSTPEASSYGIYQSSSTVRSSYDDVWNNQTDFVGVNLTGAGTISADPQFIDQAADDYHLAYNSPCIDSGDPTTAPDPDTSRADMGCYPFDLTVVSTTAVYVKSPNGGESFAPLTPFDINWYATAEIGQSVDTVGIRCTTNEGADGYAYLVTAATENDGVYNWTVPDIAFTQGKIQVIAYGPTTAADESDGVFASAATPAGPLITIEAPNGAELWPGATTQLVTFAASDISGLKANSLNIYYSLDSGATYPFTVATGQPVGSPYSWAVPGGIDSSQVRVRLTMEDINDNPGTDESDADFTIDSSAPTVSLQSPDGGEELTAGAAYTITYLASDEVGFGSNAISLYYSTGAGWDTIAADQPNTGSYVWSVPGITSSSVRVSVEAVDRVGHKGTAVSAGTFSIVPAGAAGAALPRVVIQVAGVALRAGDYIPARPLITAVVTDEAPGYPENARIYVDGTARPTTLNQVSEQRLEAYYQMLSDLEDESVMTHQIRAEGTDNAGNIGTAEVSGLRVSQASASLTGPPVASEPVFTPEPDGSKTINIVYTLNKSVATSVYMVNMTGDAVWSRRFTAGEMGAQAGYNVIAFNGISDVTGTPLGNGIYVYQLVAEGRVIGKGHIVIYE